MVYYNGQIVNPEKFRIPAYNISPFSTNQLSLLNDIVNSTDINHDSKTTEKFGNHEFTINGKEAISIALSYYNLNSDDEIWIVTTTGNKYVSSCITNEIEKYCKWSRELGENTKLIIVIHEFGTIYPDMDDLLKLNIPIIEDLAMSLFSNDLKGMAGKYGDLAIYSLPKFFPIQYGGVLSYNNDKFSNRINDRREPFQEDLKKITDYFLSQEKIIVEKRKVNYNYFTEKFDELRIKCRLNLIETETPSVFMFSSDKIDFLKMKMFLQNNGIECSQLYSENSFFLPVHQNLDQFDIDYIMNLIKYFIYENK